MSVKIRKVSKRYLDTVVNDVPVSLELTYTPHIDCFEPVVKRRESDGHWIVGYLCHDEDCRNPITEYGNTVIADRRKGSLTSKLFWQNVIYDHDREGEDYDDWFEAEVQGGKIWHAPYTVLLDVFSHSGEVWSLTGEGYQCRWDSSEAAGLWIPDDDRRSDIYYKAALEILPEGCRVSYETPNPDDPDISYLYNPSPHSCSRIAYTLPHGSRGFTNCMDDKRVPFKNFAEATDALLMIMGRWPERFDRSFAERIQACAEEAARADIASLNDWLAGDCWGVVIEEFSTDFTPISEDSCWGFIGSDYAISELEGMFERRVAKGAGDAKLPTSD